MSHSYSRTAASQHVLLSMLCAHTGSASCQCRDAYRPSARRWLLCHLLCCARTPDLLLVSAATHIAPLRGARFCV
eukprot:3433746-Pleurochrysis_carterae.AAC.1